VAKKLPSVIHIETKNALPKRYKPRRVAGGDTVQAIIPFEVFEREARKVNLNVDDFLNQYEIEYLYNHFSGVYFHFVQRKKKQMKSKAPLAQTSSTVTANAL